MRAWAADPRRVGRGLIADIKRNFPALGTVEIAHLWGGTLGRAIHRMPQIGEIESGLWVASGFGGHGLNTTAIGGELIARGIVEGGCDLAAVRALRTGLGWWDTRPGAGARHLLGDAADRSHRARPVALPRADAQAQGDAARRAQRASAAARARAAAGRHGSAARGAFCRPARCERPIQAAIRATRSFDLRGCARLAVK